jgi:O-antigen/teichoic acid export membrane protein
MPKWFQSLTPRRRRQLWYAPLLALAMGLGLSRLLVFARLLTVDQFGIFSAGVLISSSFCMLGCFGLMPMLQREWPMNLLRRQRRRGLIRAVQCAAMAGLAGAVLIVLSAMGVRLAGLDGALLMVAISHGIAQQLFLVATTERRSAGDTLAFAWQQLTRNALLLCGGGLLASQGVGAFGLLAFESVLTAASVAIIAWPVFTRARMQLSQSLRMALRRLRILSWRSALTMMSVMLLAFATANADRWLASSLLPPADFALYSFAAIVLSVSQAAQALINAAGYPMIARRQAIEGSAGAWRVSIKLSALVFVAGATLLIPMIWFAEAAVARWYPAYGAAASLLPWLGLIGIVRAADFWSSFLITAGHEVRVLCLQGLAITMALFSWSLWLTNMPPSGPSPATFVVLAALATFFTALATLCGAAVLARRGPKAAGSPSEMKTSASIPDNSCL